MEKKELFTALQTTIMDTIGLQSDEITMDSHFINDLGCDSLLLSELIMIFEDKFGLRIPDTEAEKLKTVGSVVDFIYEHQAVPEKPVS